MDMSRVQKRFYHDVSVRHLPGGWSVELDGRAIRTPARAPLNLPCQQLAEQIAGEWQGQGESLDIANMHFTRLANVAIDRTPKVRKEMAGEIVRYCETDLVCHLAAAPAELRARQQSAWRPVRDWAGAALGIMLLPVDGVIASPQPAASLDAARNHAISLDDFRLTGLVFGCSLFGSALLAMAVEQARLTSSDAWTHSRIDETFQAEQWGRDADADRAEADRKQQADRLGAWFDSL